MLLVAATASAAAGAGCPAAPGRPYHNFGNLCLPYTDVWRGNLTTDSGTASFVARAHYVLTLTGESYEGRFRCRGRACPLHHGHVSVTPALFEGGIPDMTADLSFKGGRVSCGIETLPLPGPLFAVDCNYVCRRFVRGDNGYGQVFATGTAALTPSRVPRVFALP